MKAISSCAVHSRTEAVNEENRGLGAVHPSQRLPDPARLKSLVGQWKTIQDFIPMKSLFSLVRYNNADKVLQVLKVFT